VCPKSVLVIDDDPLQLEILRDYFSRNGVLHIHLAANGQQALGLISSAATEIELIICDIYMPELDGIEFLEELGRLASRAPVILVSGGDELQLRAAEQLAHCYGVQCIDVMRKPLQLDALDRALAKPFAA